MKKSKSTIQSIIKSLESKKIIYPKELLKKFNIKIKDDREHLEYLKNSPTPDGSISGGYFHLLTLLAKHSSAKKIVELGNRSGASTIAIYHGMKKNQKLYTVDIEKDQRYVPKQIFDDERVDFIYGDCLDLGSYLSSGSEIPIDIDILWTDTVHYYDQLKSEFEVYEPLLSDEAIILIDDIRLNDKGKLFEDLKYEKFDLTDKCHSSGFGAIIYKRLKKDQGKAKQERINQSLLRASGIYRKKHWDFISSMGKKDKELESLRARIKSNPLIKIKKSLSSIYKKITS